LRSHRHRTRPRHLHHRHHSSGDLARPHHPTQRNDLVSSLSSTKPSNPRANQGKSRVPLVPPNPLNEKMERLESPGPRRGFFRPNPLPVILYKSIFCRQAPWNQYFTAINSPQTEQCKKVSRKIPPGGRGYPSKEFQ